MFEIIINIITSIARLTTIVKNIKDLNKRKKKIQWFQKRREPLLSLVRKQHRKSEKLLKILGNALDKFDIGECELSRKIHIQLSKTMWYVYSYTWSYIILTSGNEEEICVALRNLSQPYEDDDISKVINVINGVIDNPYTSDKVKEVANAVILELQNV